MIFNNLTSLFTISYCYIDDVYQLIYLIHIFLPDFCSINSKKGNLMYQFRILKLENEGYRFELGGIKMLVKGYNIINEKHSLVNPAKAFAYFTFDNSVYGISNEAASSDTAEDFYDTISQQYFILTSNHMLMEENTPSAVSKLINSPETDSNTLKHTA